jgi:hypothetical protein
MSAENGFTRAYCKSKHVIFFSEQEAGRALAYMLRFCKNLKDPETLTVFKCGICDYWHIGHKQKSYGNEEGI